MKESTIIFTLNGLNTPMNCSGDDKMKDLCQKYILKINSNMDNLEFLYKGEKINFDLSFNELADDNDKNNHEIKISVYETRNDFICPKCGEKFEIKKENINEIIKCDNRINYNLNEIKLQIANMIERSLINSNNIVLKNINKMLNAINEDSQKYKKY